MTTAIVNPRTTLVNQTWMASGAYRTATANTVNFETQPGWYVNFPITGERAFVDPRLEFGALLVPTVIPTTSACTPGGYGYTNYVDYRTGGALEGSASGYIGLKSNTPGVGVNIITLESGEVVASIVEVGDPTPRKVPGIGFDVKRDTFQGKRVIWREMVP